MEDGRGEEEERIGKRREEEGEGMEEEKSIR